VFQGQPPLRGRADLVAIETDGGSVTFQDAGGRRATYDAAASFSRETRGRNGKATRRSVAPKVLAACILDSARQALIRQRTTRAFSKWKDSRGENPALEKELDLLRRIRLDFEKLQEQEVLDNVSVGALYAFVESLDGRHETIGSVRWDAREQRLLASL
jgi:hypothetical protein